MSIHRPLARYLEDPVLARHVPYVAIVDQVLAPAACDEVLQRIEALGPAPAGIRGPAGEALAPRVRNNDRVIFDDDDLARRLWEGLRAAVPEGFSGLNERFRGYRYLPGQHFAPHTDGVIVAGGRHSELTLLVYLNGDCEGGETRFLDWDLAVEPRPGMALLFDHFVLHEGRPVTRGRKYVLRSDVMR